MKIRLIVIVAMLSCSSIVAQITTDRPDQTEASSTVGAGALQIESGILIGFSGSLEADSKSRQILAPTNLFRYGITEGIELRLLSQYEIVSQNSRSVDGISDLQIGTKIQLMKEESKATEIAFISHAIIPTGTSGLGLDDWGTINKLSISHGDIAGIGIGYNIGYDYFGDGNGSLTYSLALGSSINEKVGVYIEPYGEWSEFEDFIINADAGVTYLFNPNTQFDFSFGSGLNQQMNYISIGMSWLFQNSNTE